MGVAFSDLDAQVQFYVSRIEQDTAETTGIGLGVFLPLTKTQIQPYIEASVLYGMTELDDIDDEFSAIGFGVGGGVKYNFTNNLYIKGGVSYSHIKYDEEINNVNCVLKTTSWAITSGIGYKF